MKNPIIYCTILLFSQLFAATPPEENIPLGSYGGVAGHAAFLKESEIVVSCITRLIEDKEFDFEDIIGFTGHMRLEIAKKTNTLNAHHFGTLRNQNDVRHDISMLGL